MSVTAGTWTLARATTEAVESFFGLHEEGNEAVFDDDRELVDRKHFAPGGKYRSIIKLFMRYEGQEPDDQRHAMGTGWFVRDDTLVTAGHCAFDWSQNDGKGFGRAIEVKAYIGYNGKRSINDPSVQFRHGVQIVTTEGWLQSGPTETPLFSKDIIGVVGYPGDMQTVEWDRRKAANQMLEYRIDTYKGQSGSPVLVQNRPLISIGAHTTKAGIKYVRVGGDSMDRKSDAEDGFWDDLKDVLRVGAPMVSGALQTVSPFLGPIGGPIAALAGTAISVAAKRSVESGLTDAHPEAILSEAALQAFLRADADPADVDLVAPTILPAILPAALHLSQDIYTQKGAEADREPFHPTSYGRREPIRLPRDFRDDSFTHYLLKSVERETEDEIFWGMLGSVLSAASKGANAVQTGLSVISKIVPTTEAAFEEQPMDPYLKVLGRRALLAGATLQVLRNTPPEQLETEDFFTRIQFIMQKIGPAVMKFAPVVVSAVRPVLTPIIQPPAGTTPLAGSSSLTQGSRVFLDSSQTFFDKVMSTANECKLLLRERVSESQDATEASGSNQDGLMWTSMNDA
ncbi:ATP synthase F1 [Aspergillus neoniger CBS 115656]|uniref:Serine protease n=1 Tax=Aspergillus neoniger (strain CBS 115656) TaxID=1448310 RepID=A0A318Y205_ASPNB|nr:ATP synthase F1 [Aspergillus neoniger CBS 115656]PYH28391.1 ATP synthase F1 [Aspergillus neoniger CBS 115656]